MVHTLLIVIHASAGAISFGAGIVSMPLTTVRSRRFRVYLASLMVMAVTLAAAVAWNWRHYPLVLQITYAALTALAVFMLVRASQARNRLRAHDSDWRARYIDAVGFTLISLWVAFVVVAAIDLGAPVWLVVVVTVVSTVAAVWVKNSSKRRILAGLSFGEQTQKYP